MATETTKEKGFLSTAWKIHSTLAPWVGLFGIPVMYAFLPKAAVTAKLASPDANMLDIFVTLWNTMGKALMEFSVPGWSIILGEIGGMASTAFNAAVNAATITSGATIAAPSP